jgi:hypothetical protein
MLALFTGFELNPLQLSQYIYSLAILGTIVYFSSALRRPDQPLKVLGLAWIFVLDSLINLGYTALFGTSWFVVLAQHLNDDNEISDKVPGAGTINDTAGFTDPEFNASRVDIVATPAPGVLTGQNAVAVPSTIGGTLAGAVFESGSMASITVIAHCALLRTWRGTLLHSYHR